MLAVAAAVGVWWLTAADHAAPSSPLPDAATPPAGAPPPPARDAEAARRPPVARPTPATAPPEATPPPDAAATAPSPDAPETRSAAPADDLEPLPDASVWPLTTDGLRGALAEANPHLEDCYVEALERRPDLSGEVYITAFLDEVDGVGAITEVVSDSELRDASLEDCVLDVMMRLAFDAPPEGRLQITVPMQFSPDDVD